MLGMLFSHIFYAEVADVQEKLDGAPFMAPKASSSDCFIVACFIEVFAEEAISQASTLREAITSFGYFEECQPIVLIYTQIVLVYEFLGDIC